MYLLNANYFKVKCVYMARRHELIMWQNLNESAACE